MVKEEVLEGNKLIAKFMRYKFKNHSKYWCIYPLDDNSFLRALNWVPYNNLKFHSSWDWLMPVIEKIINTTKHQTVPLELKLCIPNIGMTFRRVVEYIKWYNKKSNTHTKPENE